jgi:hypothetical protein
MEGRTAQSWEPWDGAFLTPATAVVVVRSGDRRHAATLTFEVMEPDDLSGLPSRRASAPRPRCRQSSSAGVYACS